jgi:hypothetical protein
MKCLSLKQPWAYLLLAPPLIPGIPPKRIENRDWPLPESFKLPQRIKIHASKTLDLDAFDWIAKEISPELAAGLDKLEAAGKLTLGAIVGETDVIGMMTGERMRIEGTPGIWYVGRYGFVTANPMIYAKPIPCLGRLGFFEVKI